MIGPDTAPNNAKYKYCLLNHLKLCEILAPKQTHKHVTHTGAILNLEDKIPLYSIIPNLKNIVSIKNPIK